MGNSLSKCANKLFTLRTPPLTSGYLKRTASGIQNNLDRYFTAAIHQNHEYQRFGQSINISFINVYGRLPPQLFD